MAAQNRGADSSLARILFEEGHRFEFFQAVRLLEQLYADRRPVGREDRGHLRKMLVKRLRRHVESARHMPRFKIRGSTRIKEEGYATFKDGLRLLKREHFTRLGGFWRRPDEWNAFR